MTPTELRNRDGSPPSRALPRWLAGIWHSFSPGGLMLGTLFFAASLTPTLLPRGFL